MYTLVPLLGRVAFCATLAMLPAFAQNNDKPPSQPFEAVHLLNLSADAEKTVVAALKDINAAIAKAGCAKCAYHVWKVTGTQDGPFNALWTSSWPSGDVYTKVHNSPQYQEAIKKHPEMEQAMGKQVYNRYLELK